MLSWVSVDFSTGAILADLTDFECTQVGTVIGQYTTATGSLPVGGTGDDAPPENWDRALLEGASVLVLVDDLLDGSTPLPLWGGYITRRVQSLGDVVPVSLASLESYLDSRFVGDVTYTATGQNAIVENLIDEFVNDGTINIRVEYDGAGEARDRTYKDISDKSIYSVLTELMGVENGPEWTIGWEWLHDPERITPVLYVGGPDGSPRLGNPVPAGMGPAATFEAPGPVVSAELTRDYGRGKGANRVKATSTANADTRPESPPQVAVSERPTFEHRFTPSTSITQIPTLTSHAQSALAQMAEGARALTLAAVVQDAPRLNVDWFIGDDIGYVIGGTVTETVQSWVQDVFEEVFEDEFWSSGLVDVQVSRELVPSFPGGMSGTARCIGWEIDLSEPQTIAPILGVES